jgi:hypothetical protein
MDEFVGVAATAKQQAGQTAVAAPLVFGDDCTPLMTPAPETR